MGMININKTLNLLEQLRQEDIRISCTCGTRNRPKVIRCNNIIVIECPDCEQNFEICFELPKEVR